ncbi:MAG: phytanoyl-CoA dioxygenase family protein [Capsulimonadales bacterium]|nr:phytanoyl-CoA dioxygenase family protein [Capsulimonadales bacterium]
MISLPVTPGEIEAGKLSDDHLNRAVRAIRDDGFVVLERIVDPEHIALLRDRLIADVRELVARPDAPYNWNTGNIQQDPPPFPPYLFRDVLVNDLVIQVTTAVLGPKVYNGFYSGNTALKSDSRQPVHADHGHLWRSSEPPAPASHLVVNVPLVDMSAENGATEIWPGTHRDTAVSIYDPIELSEEHLAPWREKRPPIQPDVSAGSILIRDIRLWHAGMPNRTDVPRPMIAMIHQVTWLGKPGPLKFAREAEELLKHPDLETVAEFVDGPIDHIRAPHGYKPPQES